MNNIIECKLESTYKEIFTGLWQYDYGQKLRITGGDFPEAVEIQFSLNKKSGSVITRIGTTTDGVTEVKIPDELLKNEGQSQNYSIYAYIYLTDESSGSTEYQIVLHVKSRTKPENPSEEPLPEPNIFHETVVAVNASAERAETAEKNAKESAEKAETTLADMKETVGNLTETVEQAEKLDGNLDKKLEQGENIVANIKDKLDVPENPMVGKYLRVKAVNEDGVPELEWVDEPSGGSSLDIQINGQSIVKDGIAEIPLCTTSKAPGLIAIDTYSNSGGLYRANNDTGLVRIAKANNMSLTERKNEFCPVVPANLDYAVKCAMCDGKGAAWTAEEQAAARERMGIGEWELFADIALEEKVQKISFTIENWKELFVRIDAKAVQDTSSTTILYPFTNANFCDFYPGTGKDASIYVHMVKFDDYAFYEMSFNNKSGNSGTPKSSIVKRTHNLLNFTRDYFESGTTAKVWIMR
jgi:hypothetical protein|nr:MAG TPA: hypothetical protein [Caudoviricetes sp.]